MLPRLQLGKVVRENFLVELFQSMEELATAVQARLTEMLDEAGNLRDSQMRRDLWTTYKTAGRVWVEKTSKEWRANLQQPNSQSAALFASNFSELNGLSLVDTGVVENRILASRLALAVNEKVLPEFDDVRVRLKVLENLEDLGSKDLMRTEVLVRILVEQWSEAGLPSEAWPLVNATAERVLVQRLETAYRNANALLTSKGVLPVITLKDRVKVAPRANTGMRDSERSDLSTRSGPASQLPKTTASNPLSGTGQPFWRTSASDRHGLASSAAEETRMMTAASPLARARSRAQGVIGQIRRLFAGSVGTDFAKTVLSPPSPALAQALAPNQLAQMYATGGTLYQDFTPRGVARVADDLRERSVELKKKAETKAEKATIEIVALMFQAILAEERIPPGIRVWFARLQMPVLRVALEDADFLGSADHPARALIDRMGSCVMGFDSSDVKAGAMEAEIKRVVQVIEQYPETGRKVYQIVYDEFQKFLSKFLTEKGVTQKVVSVAQQVEQKETLAIQYTIEMRDLFNRVPVPEDIRQFLYKVWVEVMAVAAVRQGAQHTQTLALRKVAGDLMSLSSAKSARTERMLAMRELPSLLERLRQGMTLMGVASSEQDIHLKTINDALAQSFLSKAQALTPAHIQEIARRLADLEEFVGNEDVGDLPLDTQSVEWMLGPQASGSIEVIVDGGSKPTLAMVEWARDMLTGSWFVLDHNGRISNVQFLWRSAQRHLNLFASTDGRSYVIQSGRLASYLQAGLLKPQEDEPLTLRAARDALAKIEANPERLLQ